VRQPLRIVDGEVEFYESPREAPDQCTGYPDMLGGLCRCRKFLEVEIEREYGTCSWCWQLKEVSYYTKKMLSHSAPRIVYKDGRGCKGVGKMPLERMKRPPKEPRYQQVREALLLLDGYVLTQSGATVL
jgi:hypothetical protein